MNPYDNTNPQNQSCEKIADLIDGAIGEESPFQDMFGFYTQGVGVETGILPRNWLNRLEKNITPDGFEVYSLDFHDLMVAKSLANREKDWEFINDAKSAIDYKKFSYRMSEVEDERIDGSMKLNALSRVRSLTKSEKEFGFGI